MASCIIYCALTHGSIASSVNTASVDMEFGMPQLILLLGKNPMSIGRLDAFLLRPTIPSIFAWNWWSQANLLILRSDVLQAELDRFIKTWDPSEVMETNELVVAFEGSCVYPHHPSSVINASFNVSDIWDPESVILTFMFRDGRCRINITAHFMARVLC